MADKLRATAPLDITFTAGEQPSPSKLTAVARQGRTGINVLEKAVGDLWNQSGDPVMSNFPLQITSLARVMGEMRYLNPALFPSVSEFLYEDNVGNKFTGETDVYLQFKPKSGSAFSWNQQYTTEKTLAWEVDAAVDYFVDDSTGRMRLGSALTGTTAVTYTVDPSDWNVGTETLPGVVPDSRQTDYTGCRISKSGSIYYLHFPPRQPLTFSSSWERPERYPDALDYGGGVDDNFDTTVQANKRLWQDPDVNALNHEHYRYALPKDLQDQWGAIAVGDVLPTGFIYLWDRAADQVIADAIFKKTSDSWVFVIESASTDLEAYVSTNEQESSYNSTQLSVIAAGAPLSRSFWTLANSVYSHDHGNKGDFAATMEHSMLKFLNPPGESYTGHPGTYPVSGIEWPSSRWAGDDHTSLLSRAGSYGTSGAYHRDNLDNAMIGDLILADRSRALDEDLANDSFKVCFGDITGPSIQGYAKTVQVNSLFGIDHCTFVPSAGDNDDVPVTTSNLQVTNGAGGAFAITGFVGTNRTGTILIVLNQSAYVLTFKDDSVDSADGNRLDLVDSDWTLQPGHICMFVYDAENFGGTYGRWRILSGANMES